MDGNPPTVTSRLTSITTSTHADSQTNIHHISPNIPVHSHHIRRHQGARGHNRTLQSHFKSSVEGLEDAVYDSGLPSSSQILLTTTTK